MPFALLIVGIGFLVIAIEGTHATASSLLKSEFTGSGSFVPWVIAIAILSALGYIKQVKPIADSMVALILLVMLIKNDNGFFASFNQQVRNPVPAQLPSSTAASASTSEWFTPSPMQTNTGAPVNVGPLPQFLPSTPDVPMVGPG